MIPWDDITCIPWDLLFAAFEEAYGGTERHDVIVASAGRPWEQLF